MAAPPESAEWQGKAKLVVGVDFGTTYSGVAFLLSLDPDHKKIEVISEWPGKGRTTDQLHKVPTEISYEETPHRWGYDFRPGMARYGWFKLLLDAKTAATLHDDPNLAKHFDPGNSKALVGLPPGKSAGDVTSDYLKLLYAHTMAFLRRRMPESLDDTPIHFILTTPAIWSEQAQSATCNAAKKAGFANRPKDRITMISEPEAAASYTLKDLNSRQSGSNNPLKMGDQILVCDAGGGTVDLITYKVDQVEPFLKVKESIQGSGGKCGSTALDRAFLELLERRIGEPFRQLPPAKIGRGSILMNSFESTKRAFGSTPRDEDLYIDHGIYDLQSDESKGIVDSEIILKYHEMQSIFDPIIAQIISLVSGQISRANASDLNHRVTEIILVGGFGESLYLYKKLDEWASSQSPPLFVCNPKDSWSAIVKGAVSVGLQNIVFSRKLKHHYGVQLAAPYVESKHAGKTSYIDPFSGDKYCTDHVEWFAAKDEDAETDRRITIPYSSTFPESMRYSTKHTDLLICNYDEIPESPSDPRVFKIGSIPCDFGKLPDHIFQKRTFGGLFDRTTIFQGQFTIEMVIGSASIDFEIQNNGTIYGTFSLGFDD